VVDLQCLGVELCFADRNHAITFVNERNLFRDRALALSQQCVLLRQQRVSLGERPLERSHIVWTIGTSAGHHRCTN